MPNGDGNENGKKKESVGLICKRKQQQQQRSSSKRFCSFLSHWCCNLTLPGYTFYVLCALKKCCCFCSFLLFLTTAFLIFSPPLKNVYVVLPRKFVSFVCCCFCCCFLSLALALCRSFSRWALLACRLLSLSFSFSIFQILGRDN